MRELIVREFDSKVYLSKGRESSICVIDDIVVVAQIVASIEVVLAVKQELSLCMCRRG